MPIRFYLPCLAYTPLGFSVGSGKSSDCDCFRDSVVLCVVLSCLSSDLSSHVAHRTRESGGDLYFSVLSQHGGKEDDLSVGWSCNAL